jgi:hypothetical protein
MLNIMEDVYPYAELSYVDQCACLCEAWLWSTQVKSTTGSATRLAYIGQESCSADFPLVHDATCNLAHTIQVLAVDR